MKTTYETTYDSAIAIPAERECGRPIRRFQKSSADGMGDKFTIRRDNGKVVDVTMDFDPIF